MPLMKLNRNHTLATTTGHMLGFKKGVPLYVPPVCVELALAIGAEAVDEDGKKEIDKHFEGQEPKETPELTAKQQRGKLKEVLEGIASRNDRDDFKASGRPKLAVIKAQCDFPVEQKIADELWDEILKERAATE